MPNRAHAPLTPASYLWRLGAYAALALVVVLCAPALGTEQAGARIGWGALWAWWRGEAWGTAQEILLYLRLPRVVLGFLTGGTLALTGAVLQVLLRNPLATPYTLGITSGGALGASLAIAIPTLTGRWGPFGGVQLCSLVGSGAVMALIYHFARRRGSLAMNTMLLAGVTLGILCSALILLLRYFLSPNLLMSVERWMMGGLDVVGYHELASILPLLLPGVGLLLLQMGTLNQLAMGDELAAGYGVDVGSAQRAAFVGGGLATAAVVSLAGPIGFVGLIVPHAVRRISGVDHRLVAPACFLAGGAFLVLCDALARCLLWLTVGSKTELPVGVITAVIGAPFFIHLLIRGAK